MNSCVIIAKIVTCTLLTPAPPPAEAVQILAPHQYVYVEQNQLEEPRYSPFAPHRRKQAQWFDTGSSPSDGPFGSFPDYPASVPLNCCDTYQSYLPWDWWVGPNTFFPPAPTVNGNPIGSNRGIK